MRGGRQTIGAWERAEVGRSSVEASLTPDEQLRVSKKTMQRYATPAAETSYPLEYAYHLLGDIVGKTILDLGCGSGANSILLAGRGAKILGIDISFDLVRLARRRMAMHALSGRACFVVGSAHHLPLPDASIDVVFGNAILHHVDLELVSREVYRVLRPGARAIFKEPVRDSGVLRFARCLIPRRDPKVSPFEWPLTERQLSGFASRFARARARAFSLPHVRIARRFRTSSEVLARAYDTDASLLRRWPGLRRWAAVRVIELTKPASAGHRSP